jgi:DNA-binding GntR family transcriptional regulator
MLVISPIKTVDITQQCYERIRDAIFSGRFEPGERLDPGYLAEQFQVSKQPVKDALNRLRVEGMVVIKPRRGTFVREITIRDAMNILEVRLMMESYAMSRCTGLDSKIEETLAFAAEKMTEIVNEKPFDWIKYNEYDIAFHEALVSLANNPELLRAYRSLHSHYVTGRYYYGRERKASLNDPDHLAIFSALKAKDYKLAQELVTRHIQAGIEALAAVSSAARA